MIPVCEPLLRGNEAKYVTDCLRTNWISSSGKYIKKFEGVFSKYCGSKYGITTTSGTTALHLALAALGIEPGDEVIVPTFTIASTVFAILYCQGRPVFVDSEPDTWNIDVSKIKGKITKKTKAIMPVHIYGHPCDMSEIMKIAKKYNLKIVEDAAEAHGAEHKGRKAGGIGHIGCFSFYGNKIITSGEGGMVITNNKRIAQKCRCLKNIAFIEQKRFRHREIGFNYRMTNIQAALAFAQFEQIEKLIEKRRRNAQIYNSLLADVPGLTLPKEREDSKNVYWMYSVLVGRKFGVRRDRLIKELRRKGIDTRTFFVPMHQQPILKKMGLVSGERYPVAERIAREGLYLPSASGLKQKQIEFICDAIKQIRRKG